MIVVKIEMWPGGIQQRAYDIGRMTIANVGVAQGGKRGDYMVKLFRRGTTVKVQKRAEVKDYPRLSYPIWKLVQRALTALDGKD